MTDLPRSQYRIGVLSDTHGVLHPRLFELFEGVDLILHAGDIGNDDLLADLEAIAPLTAVSGNVDGAPNPHRPEMRQLTTPAGNIGLTHGHLPRASAYQPATLVRFFREFAPRIIVYGHTHLAAIGQIDGVTLFNPGAAGRIRVAGRPPSVGMITLEPGQDQPRLEHLMLD